MFLPSSLFPDDVTVMNTTDGVTAFATAMNALLCALTSGLTFVIGAGPPSLMSPFVSANPDSSPPLKFDTTRAPKMIPMVINANDATTDRFDITVTTSL
jgi:hypothetical protein